MAKKNAHKEVRFGGKFFLIEWDGTFNEKDKDLVTQGPFSSLKEATDYMEKEGSNWDHHRIVRVSTDEYEVSNKPTVVKLS